MSHRINEEYESYEVTDPDNNYYFRPWCDAMRMLDEVMTQRDEALERCESQRFSARCALSQIVIAITALEEGLPELSPNDCYEVARCVATLRVAAAILND